MKKTVIGVFILALVALALFLILQPVKADPPGAAARGRYYYTQNGKLFCYDPAAGESARILRGMRLQSSLFTDTDGSILFVSGKTLYRLNPEDNTAKTVAELGTFSKTYFTVQRAADAQSVLVLTSDQVQEVDPETGTVSELKRREEQTPDSSVSYVNCRPDSRRLYSPEGELLLDSEQYFSAAVFDGSYLYLYQTGERGKMEMAVFRMEKKDGVWEARKIGKVY